MLGIWRINSPYYRLWLTKIPKIFFPKLKCNIAYCLDYSIYFAKSLDLKCILIILKSESFPYRWKPTYFLKREFIPLQITT